MKKWSILILSMTLFGHTASATPQVVDKIVAIINNGIVLESDVSGLLHSVKINLSQNKSRLYDDKILRYQILEHLIMNKIQLQIAQKMGIDITDSDIKQTIINITQQNNMSVHQMSSRLAARGISYKKYSDQIREEMLISTVRNKEVSRRFIILPQEVEDLAKQISAENKDNIELNLSQIILPATSPTYSSLNNPYQDAVCLVSKLRKGEEFGKMVLKYSAESYNTKIGQIGWIKIQRLPLVLANALRTAEKNDIIGPIRLGVSLYIFKINDIRSKPKDVYITEVNARHILLCPSPVMTNDQARLRLEKLAQQIKNKTITFDKAAKEISEDSFSAFKGGNLGWVIPTSYNPVFRDALIKLKKGEISVPIYTAFSGWHLIQVLDTRTVKRTEDAEKDQAYRILFNRKFNQEEQSWLQENRASSYVKIMDNYNILN
ncbi:peptidylprolyl isomerase SurA [Candidatus Profftia tarda]|nr:peptidylprolyl isomerase SurA [Candidatus Profftia tarda]